MATADRLCLGKTHGRTSWDVGIVVNVNMVVGSITRHHCSGHNTKADKQNCLVRNVYLSVCGEKR